MTNETAQAIAAAAVALDKARRTLQQTEANGAYIAARWHRSEMAEAERRLAEAVAAVTEDGAAEG